MDLTVVEADAYSANEAILLATGICILALEANTHPGTRENPCCCLVFRASFLELRCQRFVRGQGQSE